MKIVFFLLYNVALFLPMFFVTLFAQTDNDISENSLLTVKEFNRIDITENRNPDEINFYPNHTGDFWEYNETDSITFLGVYYRDLKFSITREVLSDTIMTNGYTYKKIIWQNEANSVSYPPKIQIERVDSSGNIHIFNNDSDHIFFDFTKAVGETYPSHILNHYWKVTDRYSVTGFGDTLFAVDFALYDEISVLKETYSIIENFGICFYKTNWEEPFLPGGSFWGAVINGQEYGTLIVKKQVVDWKLFYPLHLGDYWVYEGNSGPISTVTSVKVIGDTLMPDGKIYSIKMNIDYTFTDTGYSYTRIDSSGNLFFWETVQSVGIRVLKFSGIVGDTIYHHNGSDLFRIENKYNSDIPHIDFSLYPSIIYFYETYALGLGLFESIIELNSSHLVGGIINGVVWGDTTITHVEEFLFGSDDDFTLYPNYPNPFNGLTNISFYLPVSRNITLDIYNCLGEKIDLIISGFFLSGFHSIQYNPKSLSTGVYIIALKSDQKIKFSKIVYLK